MTFPRAALVLLAVAAASVATWFAWLGWETGYRTLPDGIVTGPYSTMQVVAAGATITCVVVAGCLALRCSVKGSIAVVACTTVGFALAWGRNAAASDESGLWVVGLLLLVAGTAVGGSAVAVLTWLVSRRAGQRRR
ncbi:hypothetical protein [Rhodococcus artemisiae]|uniref:Tryptophan-associated transmembrane protein n=1 Tax=Rhodococcus artemisiae TaxID=714159 RepID=A0ABU7L7E9_9NOCA|nr:hypothetical protein [Rhodococcus artemisiae]MEE2057460.1 hypothetical protein [Rhodococcus artemisiae]